MRLPGPTAGLKYPSLQGYLLTEIDKLATPSREACLTFAHFILRVVQVVQPKALIYPSAGRAKKSEKHSPKPWLN